MILLSSVGENEARPRNIKQMLELSPKQEAWYVGWKPESVVSETSKERIVLSIQEYATEGDYHNAIVTAGNLVRLFPEYRSLIVDKYSEEFTRYLNNRARVFFSINFSESYADMSRMFQVLSAMRTLLPGIMNNDFWKARPSFLSTIVAQIGFNQLQFPGSTAWNEAATWSYINGVVFDAEQAFHEDENAALTYAQRLNDSAWWNYESVNDDFLGNILAVWLYSADKIDSIRPPVEAMNHLKRKYSAEQLELHPEKISEVFALKLLFAKNVALVDGHLQVVEFEESTGNDNKHAQLPLRKEI